MSKSRVVFDFGSTYFTIFKDGKILLRKPVALIVKRSLRTNVVVMGDDAIRLKGDLGSDDMFIRPVKKGVVSHKTACTELIKAYVREVFGKIAPPMCVLIGCGLNSQQKNDIEKVFIEAGVTDMFLLESLWGLTPYLAKNGTKLATIIGDETTEVGIFDGDTIIAGYSLDIGSDTVNEKIINLMKDTYKLSISYESAEELKRNIGSLYHNDISKFAVVGSDTITGRGKKITLTSKDIHAEVLYVYGRILKVLDAALIASPDTIRNEVSKTGILITGFGALIEGLRDCASKMLKVPVNIVSPYNPIVFSGALQLCNDKEFVDRYLNLGIND